MAGRCVTLFTNCSLAPALRNCDLIAERLTCHRHHEHNPTHPPPRLSLILRPSKQARTRTHTQTHASSAKAKIVASLLVSRETVATLATAKSFLRTGCERLFWLTSPCCVVLDRSTNSPQHHRRAATVRRAHSLFLNSKVRFETAVKLVPLLQSVASWRRDPLPGKLAIPARPARRPLVRQDKSRVE